MATKKISDLYYLRVYVDSIDQIISENTIIVVNPQTEVPNGKIKIVRFNRTETIIKIL